MELTNPNSTLLQPVAEEDINYSRILYLFLQKWHWFVVGILVALTGVFIYIHYYRQQSYTVDTSIMIKEDTKGLDLGKIFENSVLPGQSSVTIEDEIELLKSYTLARGVFEQLNWRTSWYKKHFFKFKGLYPNEPFLVREDDSSKNLEGIMLYLETADEKHYLLHARGTVQIDGAEREIAFEKKGTYGEPFRNEYFDFTIYTKGTDAPEAGDTYCFHFNNLNDLTLAYLGKQQIAAAGKTSNVIRLSISGNEPMREIHYLNGLVGEYIRRNLDFRTETHKRSLEFINKQLNGMSDSLHAAGSTVTRFRSQNQVLDISTEGGMVMQQLQDIEKQRSQSQMQLEYFRNLLHYMQNSDSIKNVAMPSVVGIQDPSLNAMVLKLSDLYSKRAVLSFSTHANNPTLIVLNNEVNQITGQLRENLLNLISNAQLNIKNLQQNEARISQQLNNLPVKEQELINITRNYELTSEIYTYLLQKQAETDIALASTISNVQVIDPARVERVRTSGTSPMTLYLIAFVLGLVVPGLAILGLDALNNTIHLQEDVEKLTPLTIIGNVPHSTSGSELVVIENPRAPITEAYRTIRTNLQYMLSENGRKVISIHSIQPEEGKSFSSANLAAILALNDKKVLLVGADMRKPRLHRIFNRKNEKGLSTYLIGQSSYEEVIQPTDIENLYLLAAGPVPPNPAELLERKLYLDLINRVRKEFDYIVIDNAPVSIVTDGVITGKHADLNIFILRYGVSRKDQLKFINDLAAKEVMKHPALVINDIKGSRYGYGYHYYYSYRYNYGYYSENGHGSRHHGPMHRLFRKTRKHADS